MNWINHKKLMNIMAATAMLLVSGYFIQTSFAGIGDSPLEAYFLPYNIEVEGSIGTDYSPDYYMIIVPATGRLVVTLYDITLNDIHEQLNISLIRTTRNSVGSGYQTYVNTVAESNNDYTTPDVIDIPDLARGIYFLRVQPYAYGSWSGADYKVKTKFSVFPPVVSDDIGDRKQYAQLSINFPRPARFPETVTLIISSAMYPIIQTSLYHLKT